MRGVTGMIERQEPCDDILMQPAAVKSAVNQGIAKLLEGQLDDCVQRCLAEDDKKALSPTLRHS